jgi:hypothetical protein
MTEQTIDETVPVVEVIDELPPAIERAQTRFWRLVSEQVEANAGAWCRVPGTFDPSTVTHLRQGRNKQIDATRFEVETRPEEPNSEGRKRVSIFLRVPRE